MYVPTRAEHARHFLFHFFFTGILVPSPEMEPVPTEVEVWSLNPWTISDVPQAFS